MNDKDTSAQGGWHVQDEELPPHSGSLATSLQGMTYDFARAVADVADNSITANANNIWVIVSDGSEEEGIEEPYIAIVDDGHGMDAKEIRQALMYGSPSAEDERNLGRFGLGLKTASTSQCHVLTVASRNAGNTDFDVRRWDLNFLRSEEAGGRWIPLVPLVSEIPQQALDLVKEAGTIVLWTDLSKLIPNIDRVSGKNLASFLGARTTESREHLALVFHRFIEGRCRHFPDRRVAVWVNGVALEPWDPFLEGHRAKRPHALNDKGLSLEHMSEPTQAGGVSLALYGRSMDLEAHVVPRRQEFYAEAAPDGTTRSADEAWKRAGLRNWNDRQGVYFYRLDRVIQAGGWCQLMGRDEHTKLARLSVDVDRSWDDKLFLNVTKTRIIVPEPLRKDFRAIFSSVRGYAKRVYDGKEGNIGDPPEPNAPSAPPNPGPPPPPPPSPDPEPEASPPPDSPRPDTPASQTFIAVEEALLNALSSECRTKAEQEVLGRLTERVRSAREGK